MGRQAGAAPVLSMTNLGSRDPAHLFSDTQVQTYTDMSLLNIRVGYLSPVDERSGSGSDCFYRFGDTYGLSVLELKQSPVIREREVAGSTVAWSGPGTSGRRAHG